MKQLNVHTEHSLVRINNEGPVGVDYLNIRNATTNLTDAHVLLEIGETDRALRAVSLAVESLTDALSEVLRGIHHGDIAIYNYDSEPDVD